MDYMVCGDKYRISVLTDRLIRLEYSESGWFVRDSDNLEDMKEDVNEFGGCIVNHDGDFIAGFEWAYDEIKSNL